MTADRDDDADTATADTGDLGRMKPPHDGRSTVWIRRDRLEFLKQIMSITEIENLDEVIGTIAEHYRTCKTGLRPLVAKAEKKLVTIQKIRLSP